MFVLILSACGSVALLALIEPLTRRLRERVEHFEPPPSPEPPPDAEARAADAAPPSPAEETAAYHFRTLLNAGVVGLIFLPLLAASLPINVGVLAEGFEVMLNRPATPVLEIPALGALSLVTDLQLYAAAMALALLVLGAAYAESLHVRSRWRWLVLLTVLGVAGFEVLVSGLRGYHLALDEGREVWELVVTNAWQGAIAASLEAIAGFYAVHGFLIPMLRLVGWAAYAPLRLLGRAQLATRHWLATRPRGPGAIALAAYALDRGIFDPLRQLDTLVFRSRDIGGRS